MWDFSYLISQFWQPAVFTFGFGLVMYLFALYLFPKLGLIDRPHKYGLERSPIPYYGGISIFGVFAVAVAIFVPLEPAVLGLLTGAFMIVMIGFLDDLLGMPPWVRLLVQLLAAVVLIVYGVGIASIKLPFIGIWELGGAISIIFTIIWVMAIVNAMNFVDGISGLNSGVSFIAGLTMFLLSVHPLLHENPDSQTTIATIAVIIAAMALAFLVFDFPPAKILMGDSGSTFFGFLIATLAIFSGGKVATAFLVLGIVILDMIWVVLRRVYERRKVWHGDLKHLHHRLLDLGLSERLVVLMYLTLTAIFGFSAVLLVSAQQKFFMILALVVLMIASALALIFIPKKS